MGSNLESECQQVRNELADCYRDLALARQAHEQAEGIATQYRLRVERLHDDLAKARMQHDQAQAQLAKALAALREPAVEGYIRGLAWADDAPFTLDEVITLVAGNIRGFAGTIRALLSPDAAQRLLRRREAEQAVVSSEVVEDYIRILGYSDEGPYSREEVRTLVAGNIRAFASSVRARWAAMARLEGQG